MRYPGCLRLATAQRATLSPQNLSQMLMHATGPPCFTSFHTRCPTAQHNPRCCINAHCLHHTAYLACRSQNLPVCITLRSLKVMAYRRHGAWQGPSRLQAFLHTQEHGRPSQQELWPSRHLACTARTNWLCMRAFFGSAHKHGMQAWMHQTHSCLQATRHAHVGTDPGRNKLASFTIVCMAQKECPCCIAEEWTWQRTCAYSLFLT